METKEIVTIIAAIVAVIGALVLIAGALVYFNIWTTAYITNAMVTMVAGLIILIIGVVAAWYARTKME